MKCKLSSKDCPQCIRRDEIHSQLERGEYRKSEGTNGSGISKAVSPKSTMKNINGTKAPSQISNDTHTGEKHTLKSILTRCRTWPPLDHRAKKEPLEMFEWEVPSRCFIDVGFVRLDPWAADRIKIGLQAELGSAAQTRDSSLEDKENVSPEPAGTVATKMSSFPALRQKVHDLKESKLLARRVPTVEYRVALGSCCERKRHLKNAHGSAVRIGIDGRPTTSDDWCTSSF